MRWVVAFFFLGVTLAGSVHARERDIQELPQDAADLTGILSEPVKKVKPDKRRFDPVGGLLSGLWEGSVKSVYRTAEFIFAEKQSKRPNPPGKEDNPVARYSF
jgi:hypothetical protein